MKCKADFWEYAYIAGFFAACWLWLFLAVPYHISFKEQTGVFLMNSGFIASYLLKPGAVASLAGDFLTQFFWFKPVGPVITVLCLILLWAVTRKALGKCGMTKGIHILSLLPVAVEMAFITYLNYPLSCTTGIIAAVSLAWLCMHLSDRHGSVIPFFLAMPFVYPAVGAHMVTFLLLFCIYFRRRPVAAAAGILAGTGIMLVEGYLYNLSLTGTLVYPVIPGYKLPALALLALSPASIPAAAILSSLKSRSWISIITASVSLFLAIYLNYGYTEEYMIEMETNACRGQWEKVWDMAEDAPDSYFYGTFYRNLCLARQDALPDRLLQYHQVPEGGMNVPINPGMDYLWAFSSIDQLLEVGDIPQATGCALLCQTIMPHSNSSQMLRRLAELAMIAGDNDVALKYLDLLSRTIVHRRWADRKKSEIASGTLSKELAAYREKSAAADRLFLQSDWYASLRNLAECNPSDRTAADYLMCSLLLGKKTQSFIAAFDRHYLGKDVKVPELYYEALLSNVHDEESFTDTVRKYGIPAAIANRYMEFLKAGGESDGNFEQLEEFKGTYWYYLVTTHLSTNVRI